MMPKAGGEYVYLREAYHPALGFMSGWVSLTAGFSAPIAAAALVVRDVRRAAARSPRLRDHDRTKHDRVVLIVAITLLHSFDTKVGGRVQAVLHDLQGRADRRVHRARASRRATATGRTSRSAERRALERRARRQFAIALMYVIFAYSGWNAAAYIAGEVEKPEQTLPRSLLLGTGVVMALYVLLNVVYFYAVPSDTLAGPTDKFAPVIEVGASRRARCSATRGGNLITSLIALALVSAVSAMIMAGPRVYAAMAADRALPPQLGWYTKRGVPTVAVVAQGVLGIAVRARRRPRRS